MRYAPIDPQLFVENRRRLAAELPADSIAVVHSADIPWLCADGYLRFIQNSDLFYLTGVDQEESTLILWPDAPDPAQREMLFVRETSELIAIWEGQKLTQEAAAEVSGIANVQWNDRFQPTIRRVMPKTKQVFLNYNEHARSISTAVTPDDRFRDQVQERYPQLRCERLAPILTRLRMVKSEIEIAQLRRACEITRDGFRRSLDVIRPGVMEYEIEAELIHEFVRQGSRAFAYEPIIASGANNCVLHYLDNDKECRDGDLVLMDVGAEYANYKGDLTRTVPVNGRYTKRQRAVYDAVHRVVRACIDDLIRPGVKIREVYAKQVARLVEDELIGLDLLDAGEVAKERENEDLPEEKRGYRKWFMHGVSHSLGIDVHDVTAPEAEFVEGMVVTVEPGIYLRDEGFGIRLENDIVVKAGGNLDLMADIPIDGDEIEALMAEKRG
ncbi:MAG: aminopeptidase P N-terminal domain-containing protein [Verrucomicrobiae bacterium]|nr:aminopeptidase P N-terminal domain-containing protein [Verrucomicrobiae bacterium]